MIILDASAITDMLTNAQPAAEVRRILSEHSARAVCPHLMDAEVLSAIRRMLNQGLIEVQQADEAVHSLELLPVARLPHYPLLPRAWALRDNMSAYDALYIAMAESLDAPLITTDFKLANTPGHRAEVVALS
ncbi:type II toxin-antitoxin system VapC family toxin [Nesterenkonia ebinurensis]|uniref:type II toxin-antitoxin system VapC family toxin n=1 Tax=Nesterenkonia ebinurensis TaxID=2608252 RepID=UPI00123D75DD|nr:type II toxin-antitoxin system VapC family toxin [Nesterenkonia ebinurensis]